MGASAIACPGCGETVPHGRLSCPSCGELLALVAGGNRRAAPMDGVPDASAAHGAAGAWGAVEPADAPEVAAAPAATPPDPRTSDWMAGDGWKATAGGSAPLSWTQDLEPENETPFLEPEPEPYPARPPAQWASEPATPADPVSHAVPAWPDPAPPAAPFVAGPSIPPTGSYPPGSAFAAAAEAAPIVGGGARSAGARATLPPISLGALGTSALQERVIVVGGAIATVAFFLPWASAVIGTLPLPDPWDSFGIVGAWHVVPFLLTVGTVALSQFGTRVPAWLRLGLLPLATAAFLLGLDWYYLMTAIGGWIGGYVLAVGALIMAVGSTLAIRQLAVASRNAEPPSSV